VQEQVEKLIEIYEWNKGFNKEWQNELFKFIKSN
jgi:hypothetical protein